MNWQYAAGQEALQLDCINRAQQLIAPYVVHTPVLQNAHLDELAGAQLFFKCENLQRTGAFKFRGACHALLQLPKEVREAGVYTVSSGNHGAALACAGQLLNIKVRVAVPSSGSAVKKANIARYAADIVEIEPGMAAREAIVAQWQQEDPEARFIPPYNHEHIIAGQGTAALELIKEQPHLNSLIAPVGGGGLLSGTIMVGHSQSMAIYAAEPELADDAWASLEQGQIQPAREPKTICDGLLTSLGDKTFPIIRDGVDKIIRVSEQQVIEAMQLIWQELKVIVEPSSATVLAAVLAQPALFQKQNIGLLLSGGNLDITRVPWNSSILELEL
ncbi:serine/threonine dehydratase [Aliidiomarina minuta]|uniref:Serine/threonine dehydratase n=1 Tax=Aliidiomarina minuta TaxID=880057 RepID=A0A432WB51_9GAMM|nr:pyridoxal-phosphate dependent enzyme [Aliidiomarina minuta]RUO26818.1 serine/threonine dehydratase [Aliidiomarina minuta]